MFSKIVTLGALLALTASLTAPFGAAAKSAKPAACCVAKAACCAQAKECCKKPDQAKCCKTGAACCEKKKACCGKEKASAKHAHGKTAAAACCAMKAK
jgi:hypothetical protein